jgi:flavin reductase (DIM6/NTAB) family NADH-FMN oxidoreductase RutF
MKTFNSSDFDNMDKVSRLNLINSCTGFKSANLIGSISEQGHTNLAIFSSVTHLGSNPAMLGFILRPASVPRHTYQNLKSHPYFTVNHITSDMIEKAHQSSASYDKHLSEFEEVGLNPHFEKDIIVPFVKESPVRLLCKYLNEYPIKENDTIHIIASIEKIFVSDENLLTKDQWINLSKADVVSINGLDGYAKTQLIKRLSYARVGKPLFDLEI